MASATTRQKIEKALSIMRSHDWYWMMADYSNSAYGKAYSSMRAFVELVASISDGAVAEALRNLWQTTYDYIHATMWGANEQAKEAFKAKESELMAVILPQVVAA